MLLTKFNHRFFHSNNLIPLNRLKIKIYNETRVILDKNLVLCRNKRLKFINRLIKVKITKLQIKTILAFKLDLLDVHQFHMSSNKIKSTLLASLQIKVTIAVQSYL